MVYMGFGLDINLTMMRIIKYRVWDKAKKKTKKKPQNLPSKNLVVEMIARRLVAAIQVEAEKINKEISDL